MLNFTNRGLLSPHREIQSNVTEINSIFVHNIGSTERLVLFDAYLTYSNALKHLLEVDKMKQWLNGSFVTTKPSPKDIDLVTFIDYDLVENLGLDLEKFKYPSSEIVFNVDAYIVKVYPETHTNYTFYKGDIAYWYESFTRTKRNRIGKKYPKGFVEIYF
jgi:predicted small secreted protein